MAEPSIWYLSEAKVQMWGVDVESIVVVLRKKCVEKKEEKYDGFGMSVAFAPNYVEMLA